MRSLCLLIIGDEVLAAEVEDSNTRWFLRRMARAGVRVPAVSVVGDDADAIALEIVRLRALADGLVMSGGIGPTHDDKTREALAKALDRPLVRLPEAEVRIRSFYGDQTAEAELAMADFPEGASLLGGHRTDTFGIEVDGIFAMPGVPVLFEDLVEGLLGRLEGRTLLSEEILTWQREGEVAPLLRATQEAHPEVAIGSYPVLSEGRWHVRVVLRCEAEGALRAATAELRVALADPAPDGGRP